MSQESQHTESQDSRFDTYPPEGEIEPVVYSRSEHNISRANIDQDALKIMYRLIRYGHRAYLVGGGVRDLLLEKEPKDFDIVTDATPRKIKSLFRNCRIIGRRFKLAHVYFKNQKIIEVSTFRDFSDPIDPQDENDKSQLLLTRDNRYGNEMTDAWRRDLTINGLFYDLSNFTILDYVGGFEDLRNEIVRVIGDPDIRFAEDPVRLMRVVRHAARAGFSIDPRCQEALEKNHQLLTESSEVRIYEELKKDLTSGYMVPILRLLHEHHLLTHLIPELEDHGGPFLPKGSDLLRCLEEVDNVCRREKEIPLTPILALISLFLGRATASVPELPEIFSGREDISHHVDEAFITLSVPKKERERIFRTLELWHSLEQQSIEKLRNSSLERRRHLDDAYWLLRFLTSNPSSDELLEVVGSARNNRTTRKKGNSPSKSGRSNPKRGKRSGGGRKGGGNKKRPRNHPKDTR